MQVAKFQLRSQRSMLTLLALVALAAPGSLAARQQTVPAVSQEKIMAYAKSFEAIQYAYEVGFQDMMGRTHDALGKSELRRQFEEKTASILAANGLTAEEYQRITLIISVEQSQRDAFDAALKEVKAAATTG